MNVQELRKLAVKHKLKPIGQAAVLKGDKIVAIRNYRLETEKKKQTADLKRIYKTNDIVYYEGEEMITELKSVVNKNRIATAKQNGSPRRVRNASMLWWEWQNAGKCEQWAARFFKCRSYELTKEQIDFIYNNR